MTLLKLYKQLLAHYGLQGWWPAESAFEVCTGAILTQNTAWQNVEKAIQSLKKAKMLSCRKIANAKHSEIAKLVKPSGYYNQKARKLRDFCKHLVRHYNGSLQKMLSKPTPQLRQELLSMHGIGPETADSMILYAANKPVFVIDAYTKRLNERLSLNKKAKTYEELQEFFQKNLPENARVYNEFHALLVKHAKEHCRKKPTCEKCFLKKECAFARTV